MIKRKTDDYIRNYYKTTRNALLITGARQTGKTYSIHQSGRNARSGGIIQGSENSSDMLLRLSAITSVLLLKGETLVFFDEVQQCPDIVTAIKFLVNDGSYRYWAESWTLSSS